MNDLRATFDVLIRDLSENGAKLKLGEAWTIPDRFELEVLYPNGTVEKRFSCEKRWQRGISLGAQFMDTRPGE